MTRINLTNASGWFNKETAISFDESTFWNGSNHISKATGSQTEHERLYKTASGKWVLACWSNWQNTSDSFEAISENEACQWLFKAEEYEKLEELFPGYLAEMEI